MIELPPLPYRYDALEPYLSARTLKAHHQGHVANYVREVNEITRGTALENAGLKRLITAGCARWPRLYNAAAQIYIHGVYFRSMRPGGGGAPAGAVGERLRRRFGSWDTFKQLWLDAAKSVFGSGWVWLVWDGWRLQIVPTKDANIPVEGTPVIVMDVWEHAYYLDYTFHRNEYSEAFLEELVAWPR